MDERNQRRAERDNQRFVEESGEENEGPVEIVGSHLSLWGGLVGIAATAFAPSPVWLELGGVASAERPQPMQVCAR